MGDLSINAIKIQFIQKEILYNTPLRLINHLQVW